MKILLVDDSKSARYALRLALQQLGQEVEPAESAEAAIAMLKGNLPDAILMDHMMPGLNGLEALEIIRADPHTARIPVVICTSREDADFAAEALRRGAAGILPKSTAAERLPALLNRLLGGVDQPPSVVTPAVSSSAPSAIPASVSDRTPTPDPMRQIEERIDARLTALMEPLLEDLERSLSERLLATARQLIELRTSETRELIEARLADERQAASAALSSAELASTVGRLIREAMPALLKSEVEAERPRVLALVDLHLRESLAQNKPQEDRSEERLAAREGAIVAKTLELARREATDAAAGALARAQRAADDVTRQFHSRLTWVYLAIAGAASAGILAAAASYFLSR